MDFNWIKQQSSGKYKRSYMFYQYIKKRAALSGDSCMNTCSWIEKQVVVVPVFFIILVYQYFFLVFLKSMLWALVSVKTGAFSSCINEYWYLLLLLLSFPTVYYSTTNLFSSLYFFCLLSLLPFLLSSLIFTLDLPLFDFYLLLSLIHLLSCFWLTSHIWIAAHSSLSFVFTSLSLSLSSFSFDKKRDLMIKNLPRVWKIYK